MSPTRFLAGTHSNLSVSACRAIPTQVYSTKVAVNGITKKSTPLVCARSHRIQQKRNRVSWNLIQDGARLQQCFTTNQASFIFYSSSSSSSSTTRKSMVSSEPSLQVHETAIDHWLKGIPIHLSALTFNLLSKFKTWSSTSELKSPPSEAKSTPSEFKAMERPSKIKAKPAIPAVQTSAILEYIPPESEPKFDLFSKSSTVEANAMVSKSSMDSRTRFLISAVALATTEYSRRVKVEELCRFLRQYPDARSLADKLGAVRMLLSVKLKSHDSLVKEGTMEALILLGYCKPPAGWGVRILSIDGGGLRGVMALEILRQLENQTGQPVHKMFDYICGVSTGAVLAVLLGALKSSVVQCEDLYRDIGKEIFQQNRLWGTGKLVLSHAFYNTDNWTKLLRKHIGEKILLETSRDENCPKIATISAVVNRPRLEPYLFRNYDFPPRVRSLYPGTHGVHLWEAIRASAAAPGYFEECKLGEDVHQDGGILVNNPTALALHECKHLWPNESLQCVVSLGSGRFEPLQARGPATYTGLKNKLLKIVDSATDTEAVHTILHDLLPPTIYFRFNPYLSEDTPLDETRQEKIVQLQEDTKMYLRRNESKLRSAADLLSQPRTRLQNVRDFISLKLSTLYG